MTENDQKYIDLLVLAKQACRRKVRQLEQLSYPSVLERKELTQARKAYRLACKNIKSTIVQQRLF